MGTEGRLKYDYLMESEEIETLRVLYDFIKELVKDRGLGRDSESPGTWKRQAIGKGNFLCVYQERPQNIYVKERRSQQSGTMYSGFFCL